MSVTFETVGPWCLHTAVFMVSMNAMVRTGYFSKKHLAGFLQLMLRKVESLEKL